MTNKNNPGDIDKELDHMTRGEHVEAPETGDAVPDRFSSGEVYLRVVATAEEEIQRGTTQLLVSGVAAGLTAGTSLLASIPVRVAMAEHPAGEMIASLFYGLGFVLIVIGRYQLFTENTLTPVMLVLHQQCGMRLMLRLWGIVLAGNLLGAAAVAGMLHWSGVFDEVATARLNEIARHALHEPINRLFWTSVLAGGLVATMMWLIMAVRESSARILIVLLIAFVIPTAQLHHCVFGSTETLFAVFSGQESIVLFLRFLALTVVGNTIGGVVLVSLINYAQTHDLEGEEK